MEIERYLRNYQYDNALRLAELLYAENASEEHLVVLADVLLQRREYSRCRELCVPHCQGPKGTRVRFMRAVCCYQLNKLQEAEDALLGDGTLEAHQLHLLGLVCQRGNRLEQAAVYFRRALSLDPLSFDSFTALCDLGALKDAQEADACLGPLVIHSSSHAVNKEPSSVPQNPPPSSAPAHPSSVKKGALMASSSLQQGGFADSWNGATGRQVAFDTPEGDEEEENGLHFEAKSLQGAFDSSNRAPKALTFDTPSGAGETPTPQGMRSAPRSVVASQQPYLSNAPRSYQRTPASAPGSRPHPHPNVPSSSQTPTSALASTRQLMFDSQGSEAPPDSSGEKPCKLYKVSESSEKDSMSSSDIRSSPFRSAAPAEPKHSSHTHAGIGETADQEANNSNDVHSHRTNDASSNSNNANNSVEDAVRSVLGLLGRAYLFLSLHQGEGALAALHALPPKHFMTSSAQHLVGRAHFEKAQYAAAKSALETMQKLDPYRMPGLELLSTCLWQLNQQVELCYLAQKVTAFAEGRTSPEAWCVVGNCLSLQKEHESALKTFQRALAVDPAFTYAYTLSGYEYVANEDFEKGVALFRQAIATNPRHFNAWYGLGSVYLRQEKYALAEYHFAKALSINPQNPVLYCQLGNVLHKTHKFEAALEMLATAARLAPTNPQVRYTRAEVIESMAAAASDPQEQRRYNGEALAELCLVFRMVPREAQVAFRIGVVCKRLGRASDALRYFTLAYDLDPKDNNQIKAALERLDQPDLEEDSF